MFTWSDLSLVALQARSLTGSAICSKWSLSMASGSGGSCCLSGLVQQHECEMGVTES